MIGADLEELLRRLIREELERLRDGTLDGTADDVQRLAIERAAKMRAARKNSR